jgi:methionine synthase II (cobalamin-independent)
MQRNFATTLIGSLPYDNAKLALDRILENKVTYPAWPQLPALGYSESMYVQTGCYLPGVEIDIKNSRINADTVNYDPTDIYTAILSEDISHFKHPEKYHRGLYEFIKRDTSKFKAVKGQVTGPISQGLQIADKNGRPVIYDDSYSEIVRKTVNMAAKWQADELSKRNRNVIMFFDEPSLTLLGTPFASISNDQAVEWINESMDGLECSKAIHCCGNTDWSLVLRTNIDILSFDAYAFAHTVAMFADEVEQFLQRGGTLSWGLIPSTDDAIELETADNLVKLFKDHINALVRKGIDEDLIVKGSMLTPQCGLGGVTTNNADKALDMLSKVSEAMKKHYGVMQ